MFADDIRRALPGTPRERLAELSAAVWKGFACGALQEGEAQQLAEEIAARKIVPPRPAEPRRRVGSRPRSPAEMERRRRWTSSGWLTACCTNFAPEPNFDPSQLRIYFPVETHEFAV